MELKFLIVRGYPLVADNLHGRGDFSIFVLRAIAVIRNDNLKGVPQEQRCVDNRLATHFRVRKIERCSHLACLLATGGPHVRKSEGTCLFAAAVSFRILPSALAKPTS